MDVGFHSNFVLDGRDVDWCLDLCYWLFGGLDFCCVNFLWGWVVGVACFEILFIYFFTSFFNNLLTFFSIFLLFFFFLWWNFINICLNSLIHLHNFFRVLWEVCWMLCLFCFWAYTFRLLIVFGRFGWPLEGLVLVRLVRTYPLIWPNSAGWTGWEVLTVLDEWKMALVMVLVEVERVKMAVVCQSAGTVAHWE